MAIFGDTITNVPDIFEWTRGAVRLDLDGNGLRLAINPDHLGYAAQDVMARAAAEQGFDIT